ncbi:ankyrin repeat-containing protein [Anaeramoeba ignava]|uniref:Ankyrin repeat-containing protein n=1 Tax=Anaeramoeba ignava TaxID=1746090 RepID=A0A9Q0LWR5_ANAIG|nr:ankyrin repeat-containing protein [Anaeramoeba ignava]
MPDTKLGDTVQIIGNLEELGKWNILKSIELKTNSEEFPIWNVQIDLPKNKWIEYKFIVKRNNTDFYWEKISFNRTLFVLNDISKKIYAVFGVPQSEMNNLFFAIQSFNPVAVRSCLETGVDSNNNEKIQPLHLACSLKCSFEIISLLLRFGADSNSKNVVSPLHIAINNHSKLDVISLLISYGADVNSLGIFSCLHLACQKESDFPIIRKLVESGANILSKDLGKKPVDYCNDPFIQIYLNSYSSLVGDFEKLYYSDKFCDFEIYLDNRCFQFHKLILEMRLGRDNLQHFLDILSHMSEIELDFLMKFIYFGNFDFSSKNLIENFCENLKLGSFLEMTGRKGIIKSLEKLYYEDERKDFTIFCQEQQFKVHKLVVFTRSKTIQKLLLKDSSIDCFVCEEKFQEVFMIAFIKYLYLDDFEISIEKFNQDLEKAQKVFGLNEFSILRYKLSKLEEEFFLKN